MQIKYVQHVMKRIVFSVLASLLALGVLVYVIYHVWHRVTSEVTTEVALSVTVEEKINNTGYLFRDEQVLFSDSIRAGSLVSKVADGEKIPRGGTVAYVYESYKPDIVKKIGEIEEKINLLSSSMAGTVSYRDASKIDLSIQQQIVELQGATEAQDYAAIASIRKAITLDMNKRELMLGRVKNVEQAIDQLQAEATQYTLELGACLETVTAPQSGYYYASYDGYESLYRPSQISSMTLESFRELTKMSPEEEQRFCVGKLVLNYKWWICTELTKEEAEGFVVGSSYNVDFSYNDDYRVCMKLEKMVESEDGTAVLLSFSSEQMPQDFVFDRVQPISIVKKEYTGFQLPSNAIRVIDGKKGVYVLDGSVVHFRAVSILAIVDDIYVADPEPDEEGSDIDYLQRNDVIIISGKGLYDGRILS